MKINLACGLRRAWLVGSLLWMTYLVYYYDSRCDFYTDYIKYWNASRTDYYPYTYHEFVVTAIKSVIGVPALAFILGTIALRVGSWIAKGFRPSEPQVGE